MIRLLLLCLVFPVCMSGCGGGDSLSVIPFPAELQLEKGFAVISSDSVVRVLDGADPDGFLSSLLHRSLPLPEKSPASTGPSSSIILDLDSALSGDESYRLSIRPDAIRITARSSGGLFYGVQTFLQCIQQNRVPCLDIRDYPRFAYRGFHLDSSRHFFPVPFVNRYIDLMAQYKFNTFHWHLTDDQGWRIGIPGYPRLETVGSVRGKGAASSGGFYSREDISGIVRFAAERHVEVIPEVDMPGHCVAAIASYPELSCRRVSIPVRTEWGVSNDILCAGSPEVARFTRAVIDELVLLFPSHTIHIGGDEVPAERWAECALCQKKISSYGLRGTQGLRRHFARSLTAYAASKGRSVVGWDENIDFGVSPDMTIMAWSGKDRGEHAVKKGYKVIQSPGRFCYFDKYQTDPSLEPAAAKGYLPLRKVYAWNPVPEDFSREQERLILGTEICLWTEFVPDAATAEYRLFPRAFAAAEVAWSLPCNMSWSSFRRRVRVQQTVLDSLGVRYCREAVEGTAWTDFFVKHFRSDYLR
jgi:hexosaminidase